MAKKRKDHLRLRRRKGEGVRIKGEAIIYTNRRTTLTIQSDEAEFPKFLCGYIMIWWEKL